MKLWVDATRPAPEGYIWVKSVNKAKEQILDVVFSKTYFDLCVHRKPFVGNAECRIDATDCIIDIDDDASEYVKDGGDYIKLLDWLEEQGYDFPIHIHSQNPVGIENMRRIIKRNGWKEV